MLDLDLSNKHLCSNNRSIEHAQLAACGCARQWKNKVFHTDLVYVDFFSDELNLRLDFPQQQMAQIFGFKIKNRDEPPVWTLCGAALKSKAKWP